MESERLNQMYTIIEELKNIVEEPVAKKLNLDKCRRIIQRLDSFSSDCDECNQHFHELENHILQLKDKLDHLTESDIKNHQQLLASISSHMQKQHKLVPSGHYLSIYMSLGVSLGVVFGLLLFDNMALGIPIGMGIGVAVGSGLDADAKKKGMTL